MRMFVFGLIIGLVVVPVAVYVYFASGSAPVATSAPAMPFEKMLAKKALHARLDREIPKSVPITADEFNYAAGAQIYEENCAVCHGLPGKPQTTIAKGMYPKPPALLEGKGVTDDPAAESFWKVDGGIRMTGMPGFKQSLTTTQMWQVSILLADAAKLPKAVKDRLANTSLQK